MCKMFTQLKFINNDLCHDTKPQYFNVKQNTEEKKFMI